MPPSRSIHEAPSDEWEVYDAILMELAVTHPSLTIFEEAALKDRLLKVIDITADQRNPAELMRLFQEAMDGI